MYTWHNHQGEGLMPVAKLLLEQQGCTCWRSGRGVIPEQAGDGSCCWCCSISSSGSVCGSTCVSRYTAELAAVNARCHLQHVILFYLGGWCLTVCCTLQHCCTYCIQAVPRLLATGTAYADTPISLSACWYWQLHVHSWHHATQWQQQSAMVRCLCCCVGAQAALPRYSLCCAATQPADWKPITCWLPQPSSL